MGSSEVEMEGGVERLLQEVEGVVVGDERRELVLYRCDPQRQ